MARATHVNVSVMVYSANNYYLDVELSVIFAY